MGKVVVSEFVSLDGVMEAPGGEPGYRHTGWVFDYQDDEQVQHKYRECLDAGALLLGRVTYESFAGAWPNYEGDFADRMNAIPKYVVTTTLRELAWNNSTVVSGDLTAEITALKQMVEGDLLVTGSRTLVHWLAANGLVDEYRLIIFPVVLGSGFRVWASAEAMQPLKLISTTPFANGTVELVYRVLRGAV